MFLLYSYSSLLHFIYTKLRPQAAIEVLTVNIYFYYVDNRLTLDDVDKDYFKTFNKVNGNRVTVDDLITYLTRKHVAPIEEIVKIVNYFDTEEIGSLNENQYMELIMHMRPDEFEELDLNDFDAFDMNGDGFIDAFELFVVLNNMRKYILYDTAVEMINKADEDNDNKINRNEFKKLFEDL